MNIVHRFPSEEPLSDWRLRSRLGGIGASKIKRKLSETWR